VQYVELQDLIAQIPLSEENDKWVYIWWTGNFSCSKAYKHLNAIGKFISFPLGVEISLSAEAQDLLLDVVKGQAQHKRVAKKKKYGPT
jgi:hypothetical protein